MVTPARVISWPPTRRATSIYRRAMIAVDLLIRQQQPPLLTEKRKNHGN